MDGLTVAQVEYDRELTGRRDAEAEVTRLRVLLSGQTARLTVLAGDSRRQELRQQMSKELHENLSGLEHDVSKLKVQRDMTLAEVEELSAVGYVSIIFYGLGNNIDTFFIETQLDICIRSSCSARTKYDNAA